MRIFLGGFGYRCHSVFGPEGLPSAIVGLRVSAFMLFRGQRETLRHDLFLETKSHRSGKHFIIFQYYYKDSIHGNDSLNDLTVAKKKN